MSLERFQFPYLSTAQRTAIIINDRDVVYDTNLKSLWIGDGVTYGGQPMQKGEQGAPGANGANGAPGSQGAPGVGTQGAQGAPGSYAGIPMQFLTDTFATDPGTGGIKFNAASFAGTTTLYISKFDKNSIDISAWILALDDSTSTSSKGTMMITSETGQVALFSVTLSTTSINYYQVTVYNLGAPGSLWANNTNVFLTFSRTGNDGATGTPGTPSGYRFAFNKASTTVSDPGTGWIKFNSSVPVGISMIMMSYTTQNSADASGWIGSFTIPTGATKGHLLITRYDGSASFYFAVTGVTQVGAYYQIAASWIDGGMASFINGDSVFISFIPNGNDGSGGNQGAPGADGVGTQGPQGAPGADGVGTQGAQGAQGAPGAGAIDTYSVQGNQVTAAAQTVTDIFTPVSVSPSSTYRYEIQFGAQATGTQGAQFGVVCSGATVEGVVMAPASTSADKSYRQAASGVGTLATQNVAGIQTVRLSGLIITPAGSPTIGVQVKGVQASQAWYIKPNGVLKLTKIS